MSRVKASSTQLNYLIEHMQGNPEFAAGRAGGLQGRADLEQMWEILGQTLNALGGPQKSVEKWKQTWRDLRSGVKKKALKNKKEFKGDGPGGTGNGPPQLHSFTAQDEAVMSVVGPVAIYGMDGVSCTAPEEDAPCPPTQSGVPIPVPVPVIVQSSALISPICSTPGRENATTTIAFTSPTPASPTLTFGPMPAPAVAPVCATSSVAPPPTQTRPRIRRRPRIQSFDSQLLEHEKGKLEVKKKTIELAEKQMALQEKRLLVEEAKVQAFVRIAAALEKIAENKD